MKKELKKCYQYLDLPYNSTTEDVETRKNALIKILSAKENEKNINCKHKIEKTKQCATSILENIKINGIPQDKQGFQASGTSILILLVVLAFAAMFCYFSFYAFM